MARHGTASVGSRCYFFIQWHTKPIIIYANFYFMCLRWYISETVWRSSKTASQPNVHHFSFGVSCSRICIIHCLLLVVRTKAENYKIARAIKNAYWFLLCFFFVGCFVNFLFLVRVLFRPYGIDMKFSLSAAAAAAQ